MAHTSSPSLRLTLLAAVVLLAAACSPGSLRVEFGEGPAADGDEGSSLPQYPGSANGDDATGADDDIIIIDTNDDTDDTGDGPPPVLNHASFGTRCLPGAQTRYLVLSDTPVDCAADADRIDTAAMSGQLTGAVALELDADLPTQRTVQYCPQEGSCQQLTLDVAVDDQGSSLSGSWTGTIDGTPRTIDFDATPCDYDTAAPPIPGDTPAAGISVDEVAVYQAVKIPVVENGAVVSNRNAPIIAGRPGVARVFVQPEDDWQSREILVRLTVDDTAMEETFTPTGPSTETAVDSTVNFDLGEGVLPAGADFSVELLEVDGCAEQSGALAQHRVPQTDTAPLQSEGVNSPLRITLVPIQYDADGSGRVPELGNATVERFRTEAFTHYPVEDVEITVRNPVSTNIGLAANGDGFGSMLNLCLNTRAGDNPDPDVYYFCVIQPSDTAQQFCGQGCVGGVAPVPGASDVNARGGIGISFGGDGEGIMVHEIGHALGRPHSPCGGAAGADPNYPYTQGQIGSWGYNVMNGQLFDPSQRADFMGYCNPSWVSDYTYDQIFDRIDAVLGTASFMVSTAPTRWRTAVVESDGDVAWGGDVTLDHLPTGSSVPAELLDPTGSPMQDVDVYVTPIADIDAVLVTVEDTGFSGGVIDVPGLGQLQVQ